MLKTLHQNQIRCMLLPVIEAYDQDFYWRVIRNGFDANNILTTWVEDVREKYDHKLFCIFMKN